MSIICNIYRLDSMLFIRHCVFLKYLKFRVNQKKSSIRYFRVTYGIQSMETAGSRLEISGDVDYLQYLSIGLYVIHPTLCFLKIFEISRKFRKNRQFDISQ